MNLSILDEAEALNIETNRLLQQQQQHHQQQKLSIQAENDDLLNVKGFSKFDRGNDNNNDDNIINFSDIDGNNDVNNNNEVINDILLAKMLVNEGINKVGDNDDNGVLLNNKDSIYSSLNRNNDAFGQLALNEIHELNKSLSEMELSLRQKEEDLENSSRIEKELKNEKGILENMIEDYEKVIDEKDEMINNLKNSLEELNNKNMDLTDRIKVLEEHNINSSLSNDKNKNEKQLQQLQNKIEEIKIHADDWKYAAADSELALSEEKAQIKNIIEKETQKVRDEIKMSFELQILEMNEKNNFIIQSKNDEIKRLKTKLYSISNTEEIDENMISSLSSSEVISLENGCEKSTESTENIESTNDITKMNPYLIHFHLTHMTLKWKVSKAKLPSDSIHAINLITTKQLYDEAVSKKISPYEWQEFILGKFKEILFEFHCEEGQSTTYNFSPSTPPSSSFSSKSNISRSQLNINGLSNSVSKILTSFNIKRPLQFIESFVDDSNFSPSKSKPSSKDNRNQ